MRTTPNITKELRRLDDAINNKLIPFFTDNKLCGNDGRLLLSLPAKFGGMRMTAFYRIHKNRISKLASTNRITQIINSTTRKNIQNSRKIYKQHHEESQLGKTRV